MPQFPIRSSHRYEENDISSDPFWEHMEGKFPGFYKDGLRLYLEHKIHPSHSLHAILTGNLFEAAARCDGRNWAHLKDWVNMLHNHFPANLYGDNLTIDQWLAHDRYDMWVNYYVPRVKALAITDGGVAVETDITIEGMEEASAV